MDKSELIKNRLDLECGIESQKLNAFLIFLTTGVLGFMGTFIFVDNTNLFVIGLLFTFSLFFTGVFLYKRSSRRIKEILKKIDNLEE